jgi:hypothetical protein
METITMLFSFLFSYFLLFIWLPSLVVKFDEENSSVLDKLFISLTHSNLFFMIVVHFLIGIRLFETITLMAVIVTSLILLSRYYSRSESLSISIRLLTTLFDLSEERDQWKKELRNLTAYIRNRSLMQVQAVKQGVKQHPLLITGYLLVFGAVIVDRFSYSFTHLRFAMSDGYAHLSWSKIMGNMTMYSDGVYPYGFESIISTLYVIFHIDVYTIIRFIGPLTAILMMLSLIFTLRRMIGKNYIAILLTVFLLCFSSAMLIGDPSILKRQVTALSMEYTAIFLLPGITFLHSFLKSGKRYYLLLAAECYAIAAFAHTFVAVTMTIAFIAVGIAHFGKLFKNKTLITILLHMGVAGFIGILPPLIGLLMGIPFHGTSLDYVKDKFITEERIPIFDTLMSFAREQYLIAFMCLSFFIYLISLLFYRLIKRNKEQLVSEQTPLILAGAFLIMMTIATLSHELGLPSLVPNDRQTVFLMMATALFFGTCTAFFSKFNRGLKTLGCALIIIAILFVPGQKMIHPKNDLQEYDEAVRGYLDIKANYPLKSWNIISPVDELGLIRGYGYHTELWEFVRDIDDPDLLRLKFTTPFVFLFVEKVPLDILGLRDYRPVTLEEAEMPFPVHVSGPLTEFYYWFNLQNRRILEAKAYYWAEDYLENNKDMKVFLETSNYKIYIIFQNKDEVILTKKGR